MVALGQTDRTIGFKVVIHLKNHDFQADGRINRDRDSLFSKEY